MLFPMARRFMEAPLRVLRNIEFVFARHSGVAVTVAGTVVASGGILVGLAGYETSRPHSVGNNLWFRLGLVGVLIGVLMSVSVLVMLVVVRVRDERTRGLLVVRMAEAMAHVNALDEEVPVAASEIDEWNKQVEDDLYRIDPSGSC